MGGGIGGIVSAATGGGLAEIGKMALSKVVDGVAGEGTVENFASQVGEIGNGIVPGLGDVASTAVSDAGNTQVQDLLRTVGINIPGIPGVAA